MGNPLAVKGLMSENLGSESVNLFKSWREIFWPSKECGNRNREITFDRIFRQPMKTACLDTSVAV